MANRKRRFGVVEKPPEAELLPVVLKKPRIVVDEEAEEGHRTECVFKSEAAEFFRGKGFEHEICQKFEAHRIQFDHLATLTPSHLSIMNISAVGTQMELMKYINQLLVSRNSQGNEKVFNDPIHGHIELHPLLITIMDTPQFQRLRYIKQLGGGYFVFPGASHNRFEHCIGVAYLAGEFVESIARRQPELNITQSDILCVKIAGLCHDLGHGPFSHLFDGQFIPRATNEGKKWKHEQGSVLMLDYLIECNNLLPELNKYGLCEKDLVFIKELIFGPSTPNFGQALSSSYWLYQGRPIEKSFLYEIVANKRTGIDVDKWDYFARDCHCLGIPNNFDWKRYTKFARVIKVDGVYQICCRDKEVTNLYEMFHTRASLHRRAYQHKTAKIVEEMITEALLEADNYLLIPGKNNKPVRISEAIHDPYAYTNLNDSIIFTILQSTDPRLKPSQDILNKLHKRQLYKCIGQTQPSADVSSRNETVLRSEIFHSCTPTNLLSMDDIIVKVMTFDYGMKDKNPIDQMRFYSKHDLNKAYRVQRNQVSTMLPHNFIEKTVSVYCKKHNKECLNMAKRCFVEWCNNQPGDSSGGNEAQLMDGQHLAVDQGNSGIPEFTPYGTPFGTPMKFEDKSSTEKEDIDSTTPVELGTVSLTAKDTNNTADTTEDSRQTAKKKLF